MNSWDFEPSRTLATLGRHVRTAEEHQRKSSRERRLAAPSHTTGHAGPHPAGRQALRN